MYQKLQVGRAAAVTPSDTTDIQPINGGTSSNGCVLYIGGAGNVRVTTDGGDDVVFVGLAAGQFIPVQVTRVWATNTTATNIVALW